MHSDRVMGGTKGCRRQEGVLASGHPPSVTQKRYLHLTLQVSENGGLLGRAFSIADPAVRVLVDDFVNCFRKSMAKGHRDHPMCQNCSTRVSLEGKETPGTKTKTPMPQWIQPFQVLCIPKPSPHHLKKPPPTADLQSITR